MSGTGNADTPDRGGRVQPSREATAAEGGVVADSPTQRAVRERHFGRLSVTRYGSVGYAVVPG